MNFFKIDLKIIPIVADMRYYNLTVALNNDNSVNWTSVNFAPDNILEIVELELITSYLPGNGFFFGHSQSIELLYQCWVPGFWNTQIHVIIRMGLAKSIVGCISRTY